MTSDLSSRKQVSVITCRDARHDGNAVVPLGGACPAIDSTHARRGSRVRHKFMHNALSVE